MRIRPIQWLILPAILILAPAVVAQEQGVQTHEGFWIGFGVGSGWGGGEPLLGIDEGIAMAVDVRMGKALNQRWLLGAETMAWLRGDVGQIRTRANATLSAIFYPWSRGGFYAKGGFGVANRMYVTALGTSDTEYGFGATFGLGYDIRLGDNLYLTPNVDLLSQSFETSAGASEASVVIVTMGLVWH